MEKYQVAFVTGSRADYGIVRGYLNLLNNDEEIEFSILATGALLDGRYGNQVQLIIEDGFFVKDKIQIPIDTRNSGRIVHTMSIALDKFGEHFEKNYYDMLIALGDRYEIFSAVVAAAMQKVPILHLHGGELTYGNYDEFIRHAITKMSSFHFTSTEEYRRRVIQLGENPGRVFYLGALGAENCLSIDEDNVPIEIKILTPKNYFVVLFHPETLTNISVLEQVENLLEALSEYKDYQFVFLGTNADTHADVIRNRVREYVGANKNCVYYENLHSDAYHYLLKNGICLIGNSSSGIIEAPSLGIYTINIGERQRGRTRGNSVLDVACNKEDLCFAISKVLKKMGTIMPENPYYLKNSAQLYYEKTKAILEEIRKNNSAIKVFYDL